MSSPTTRATPAKPTKSDAPPAPAFSAEDEKWMAVALERGARGSPSPNPHVGAVVVKGGHALGTGHHERAGGAERLSLRVDASKAARGEYHALRRDIVGEGGHR